MPIELETSRPPTSRDVAAAVGVNQSTVSRALRNDPKIRPELREKIQNCAREMGYRPNPFVAALTASVRGYRRSPKGATLALLDCYPKKELYHYVTYRGGAERRARELGFQTEVFNIAELDGSFKRLNQILWTRAILGVLILPVPLGFDISELAFERLATSTVDTSVHRVPIHRAEPDYFQGMQLALSSLEERGYKRMCFCTTRGEVGLLDEEWLGSFTGWQAMRPEAERMSPFIGEGYDPAFFKAWLKKHKPDAIIANSKLFFEWSLAAGYDTKRIAHVTLSADPRRPEVAGIDQNQIGVGAAAVDLILGQIHHNDFGVPTLPKKTLIPGSWVQGATIRDLGEVPTKRKRS